MGADANAADAAADAADAADAAAGRDEPADAADAAADGPDAADHPAAATADDARAVLNARMGRGRRWHICSPPRCSTREEQRPDLWLESRRHWGNYNVCFGD